MCDILQFDKELKEQDYTVSSTFDGTVDYIINNLMQISI